MTLLQSAETRLGPIACWPSNILNNLFFESPTFWTTLTLINFFYGNGVRCSLAVQLFHACNDTTDALMSEKNLPFLRSVPERNRYCSYGYILPYEGRKIALHQWLK